MESDKSAMIYFYFKSDNGRWIWTSGFPKPNLDRVSKGQWRQFSFWMDRQDESRAGFEEAVEQFKRIIEDTNTHVLVIDDDSGVLTLLVVMLSRAGLWVKTASSGYEGLEVLKRENFALLILDDMLPEIDGFEVLKQIRADPRWDSMPILMFGGRQDTEAMSFKLGADGWLTKPYFKELPGQVQALLIEGRKKPDVTAGDK